MPVAATAASSCSVPAIEADVVVNATGAKTLLPGLIVRAPGPKVMLSPGLSGKLAKSPGTTNGCEASCATSNVEVPTPGPVPAALPPYAHSVSVQLARVSEAPTPRTTPPASTAMTRLRTTVDLKIRTVKPLPRRNSPQKNCPR